MILIRGVTKVENCFCYTFLLKFEVEKNFLSFYMHEDTETETVFVKPECCNCSPDFSFC